MELVGIFLLLAPLGALILYIRRTAVIAARQEALAGVAAAAVAPAFAEPPPAEPEVAASVEAEAIVEEVEPRRAQV